jgi:hypothetical protein
MKKPELLLPPLFIMTAYCENKGYDVIPVFERNKYRFLIFKNNVLKKISQEKFPSWKEGQKIVYSKLYKAINHANK